MSYGDSTYQERRERRIERYLELADKRAADSTAAHRASAGYVEGIPFGQPILVGHHSERRHRNALRKSWDALGRAVKAHEKAEYWRSRAQAAASNNAIYRDDPEAVKLLKEKLAELEADQQRMKDINAAYRKFKKNPAALDKCELTDAAKALIRNFKPEWSRDTPAPSYRLQNNNANIRRVKLRIAGLERVAVAPAPAEIRGNGISLIKNPHNGRYEMRFPGKPSPATIKRMKAGGWIARRKDGEWYWLSSWSSDSAKALASELMGVEIK